MFSLPVLHRQLNKHIQKINTILRGTERISVAPIQHVPGAFPRYRYPDIKLQLLKNRLNYLDGKENLSFSEAEEMMNLKDFIIQKMMEEF